MDKNLLHTYDYSLFLRISDLFKLSSLNGNGDFCFLIGRNETCIVRQVPCNKGLSIFIIHKTKFIFVILWYPKLIYVEILLGLQAGLLVIMSTRVWDQENGNYF